VRLERWALAVHLAAAGALVAAPWLAQPTPRTPPYFGHLVPDLPHFSPYAGRVDGASIDGHVVPHGRVPGSAVLEARLAGDFALSFHLRTAAPPTGLAALVMLTDAGSHEILLVGVDGDDLVVHQRTRARELGLEKARLRADHALRGVEPGTSLEIGLTRRGDDFALAVDGTPVAHFALTLGGGWRWLAPGWRLPAALRRGLDALWMGLLWMAVGVFHGAAPRGRVLALGLLAIAVGIPAVSLLGPSPAAEWLGAALGLVAGLWLWRALAGHVAGETSSSGSPAASPSAPPR
jgi:hypothetical protein